MAQDSLTITSNGTLLQIEFQSGVQYSFKKNNIELERWGNNLVVISDNSGRKLKINYSYVISPVVADADDLIDSLILYRETSYNFNYEENEKINNSDIFFVCNYRNYQSAGFCNYYKQYYINRFNV